MLKKKKSLIEGKYGLFFRDSLWRVQGEAERRQTNDVSVVCQCFRGYCTGLTRFTNGPYLLLIAEAFDSRPGPHLLNKRQSKQFPHAQVPILTGCSQFEISVVRKKHEEKYKITDAHFPLRQRFREFILFIYFFNLIWHLNCILHYSLPPHLSDCFFCCAG